MTFAATHATAWALLVIASLLEIVWSIGMKYSDGFTRLWPSLLLSLRHGSASGSWPMRSRFCPWVLHTRHDENWRRWRSGTCHGLVRGTCNRPAHCLHRTYHS